MSKDTTSPLMKQYHEIKSKYKDDILFFRLGDFYEMFYNDAIIASKVLGLTLTKRNREKDEDVPLAGVPYHSATSYINKLVSLGYKVAICEQVENPKDAKGIVKREVVRVITPGTIIDIDNLEAKSNNFIASIFFENNSSYFAYIDITTGLFNACEIDINNTTAMLYKLDIKELVLTKSSHSILETLVDNIDISISICDRPKKSVEILTEYFNITSLDSFGLYNKNMIDACACLLEYILETQLNIELNISKISIIQNNNYANINLTTAKNLELIKNQRDKSTYGTLLWVIDKCKTSMGSRLIKEYLNYPLMDIKEITKRQDDIKYLIDNFLLREDIKENLSETYDLERILSKIIFGNENGKDIRALYHCFKNYKKIANLWKDKFINIDLQFLDDLSLDIDRYLVDDPPFSVREASMIRHDFNEETKLLNDILHHGKNFIINIENKEKEKTGIKSLKIKYNKIFGYFIELTKSNLDTIPDYFIRKQTLSNCERFITEELKDYEDKIINAKAKLVELEYNLFKELTAKIKHYKKELTEISKIIAYIDVITSFATVSINNNYCRPTFNDDGEINILNARHPVIEKLISTQFIENDVHFKKNENFIILTGPNMAGKSTYMKQIALISILAQIGMYVPADTANLSIIDKFLTRIGASDDILTGQSTFMLEMSEVANILNSATKQSLIILDEVGRGTSTYDGLAIASSISTYIHDNIGAKTIFATHYHELNELETKYENIVNYRINVEEKNSKVIFLRTISKGSADKSYGNYVAKLAGIPTKVLKDSKNLLSKFEKRNLLIQNTESIGQLSLFDNTSYEEDNTEQKLKDFEELKLEIEEIDINNTTPIKALQLLNSLKEIVKNMNNL